ncbi:MAG: hypothetical protein DRK00_08530 [Thermoprotei archaeon]|nr:MAG: hypothetical protein DRK00_08530 [Thermoprotei archaeon]
MVRETWESRSIKLRLDRVGAPTSMHRRGTRLGGAVPEAARTELPAREKSGMEEQISRETQAPIYSLEDKGVGIGELNHRAREQADARASRVKAPRLGASPRGVVASIPLKGLSERSCGGEELRLSSLSRGIREDDIVETLLDVESRLGAKAMWATAARVLLSYGRMADALLILARAEVEGTASSKQEIAKVGRALASRTPIKVLAARISRLLDLPRELRDEILSASSPADLRLVVERLREEGFSRRIVRILLKALEYYQE